MEAIRDFTDNSECAGRDEEGMAEEWGSNADQIWIPTKHDIPKYVLYNFSKQIYLV